MCDVQIPLVFPKHAPTSRQPNGARTNASLGGSRHLGGAERLRKAQCLDKNMGIVREKNRKTIGEW